MRSYWGRMNPEVTIFPGFCCFNAMVRYKNLSGNSGVVAYQTGEKSIIVKFEDGGIYLYDLSKPGAGHVEEMKRLAVSGKGLATYINKYVRNRYARKLR